MKIFFFLVLIAPLMILTYWWYQTDSLPTNTDSFRYANAAFDWSYETRKDFFNSLSALHNVYFLNSKGASYLGSYGQIPFLGLLDLIFPNNRFSLLYLFNSLSLLALVWGVYSVARLFGIKTQASLGIAGVICTHNAVVSQFFFFETIGFFLSVFIWLIYFVCKANNNQDKDDKLIFYDISIALLSLILFLIRPVEAFYYLATLSISITLFSKEVKAAILRALALNLALATLCLIVYFSQHGDKKFIIACLLISSILFLEFKLRTKNHHKNLIVRAFLTGMLIWSSWAVFTSESLVHLMKNAIFGGDAARAAGNLSKLQFMKAYFLTSGISICMPLLLLASFAKNTFDYSQNVLFKSLILLIVVSFSMALLSNNSELRYHIPIWLLISLTTAIKLMIHSRKAGIFLLIFFTIQYGTNHLSTIFNNELFASFNKTVLSHLYIPHWHFRGPMHNGNLNRHIVRLSKRKPTTVLCFSTKGGASCGSNNSYLTPETYSIIRESPLLLNEIDPGLLKDATNLFVIFDEKIGVKYLNQSSLMSKKFPGFELINRGLQRIDDAHTDHFWVAFFEFERRPIHE